MKFAAAIVLLFALASVVSARPVGLRSLLSDDKEKEPIYCTGVDYSEDECPKHYECAALKEKVCKDCVKDDYGKDKCTHKEHCWEYACVEIPKYCEVTYAGKDECATKYGKDLECKKLDKEECVNDKECKHVDTKVCKEYEYEHKCVDVPTGFCLKYNQERKCEDKKVCKVYKQEKVCEPGKDSCAKYHAGKCTKYGPPTKQDCKFVDTKECKEYKTVKGECKYVNTTCKEYKKVKKCEKVKKGCKLYEQEEVCDDVKVCWTGKCVEVPKKNGYFGK